VYNGFKDDNFYLSNFPFDIKISNFEHSVVPNFYGMINMKNKDIMFADKINPYYDLYVFLNDLLMKIPIDSKKYDKDTIKFLDKIIPPQIRGDGNFNKNIIIGNPADILYDVYFEEYKNKPSKNLETSESITNHMYLTSINTTNINTFMESDNFSILGNQDKIISKSNIMITNSRTIKQNKDVDTIIYRSMTSESDIAVNKRTIKNIAIQQEGGNKRQIKQEMNQGFNQIGGDEKPTMAPYRAEKNNPFLTNENRETNKKFSAENPQREPPVISVI
jgi:hypothetical protein